jgi:hypothetical protein
VFTELSYENGITTTDGTPTEKDGCQPRKADVILAKVDTNQEKAAADKKADKEEMEADIKAWREEIAAETEAIKARTKAMRRKYGHQPLGDGCRNQTRKRHGDDGLPRNDRGASRRRDDGLPRDGGTSRRR